MGLFDKFRAEFIDIIEWIDDSRSTLVWRFPRYHNQIKNGAQLIVRPGQVAIFVHRGQLADVFQPGSYTLKADNLPVLSTLLGWKYGFDSPFKSEVYFVSTRPVVDLKWGTPNPIMLRDPDFGPLRLRAFGVYTLRATDPKELPKQLVGTDSEFQADEVGELMRAMIITSFSEILARKNIAAMDLAANYREISEDVRKAVIERVDDEYGLDVPQLLIVNISLPEEVEKTLDARTRMGVIGDMEKYQQFQMANAITMAAGNPAGGGASEGMGLGLGFAMAQKFMPGAAGGGAPPSLAGWYYASQGKQMGPVSVEEIAQLSSRGAIQGTTLVWKQGMAGWQPMQSIPEIAPLAGAGRASGPPPLPQ